MPPETVCKIVCQYNKAPICDEDMGKLQEIAQDYGKVKNYVYQQYGGIRSLSKLYPGYTVQNEMTRSRLRERLEMPSVYFYLAIFDALGDIKSQWTRTKAQILKNIGKNEKLTDKEKHFLRYLLKVNPAFEAILNNHLPQLPKEMQRSYNDMTAEIDTKKLASYLQRQVRRYHIKPHTEGEDSFSISERAYRYGDHGIYISIKEKRKRVFIPLTDGNSYTRQIRIRLFPEEKKIVLRIPVDVTVKRHPDYKASVGVSMGMMTMLATDQGHIYGEKLRDYQGQLSDWIRRQSITYNQNRENNPGRKKYYAKKGRLEEQLHSYINQELNRFFKEEKPAIIYIPKLPGPGAISPVKKINHYSSTWQRGYIRERLTFKCRQQSVQLIEVFGKDISSRCSNCGASGRRKDGRFVCSQCGYEADGRINTAQNIKKRGEEDHKDKQTDKWE